MRCQFIYLIDSSLKDFVITQALFIFIVFLSPFIYSFIHALIKKGVLGEHTIEITPDYFREATAYNDDKYNWNKIKKIKQHKQYIIICISWRAVFFLSLKDFSTPEECKKFYNLAVSYHNQAKKAAN